MAVKNLKVNIDEKKSAADSTDADALVSDQNDQVQEEDTDSPLLPFLWLFVFSIMMFSFPFLTFYGVKDWLKTSFVLSMFEVNCYSVLSAVVVVNLIISMFVWKAFTEKVKPLKKNE